MLARIKDKGQPLGILGVVLSFVSVLMFFSTLFWVDWYSMTVIQANQTNTTDYGLLKYKMCDNETVPVCVEDWVGKYPGTDSSWVIPTCISVASTLSVDIFLNVTSNLVILACSLGLKLGNIPRRKWMIPSLFVAATAFLLNFVATSVYFTSFYGNSCTLQSRRTLDCSYSIGPTTYLAFAATILNLVAMAFIAIATDKERKRVTMIV